MGGRCAATRRVCNRRPAWGIGLILGELTNIHDWRFGRSFAGPVPGSGLADNAPACRAGALRQSGIRVTRSCPWRTVWTRQRAMPGCASCRRRKGHRHRLCRGCARCAEAKQGRAATTATALRVRLANPGAGPDGCPGIKAPSEMATGHPAIPSRMQGRRYAVAFPGCVSGAR
jgi:hypothetical protein